MLGGSQFRFGADEAIEAANVAKQEGSKIETAYAAIRRALMVKGASGRCGWRRWAHASCWRF